MLLPGSAAYSAAYAPGVQEPDPPTGDGSNGTASASSAEPLAGSGIRWQLAPWRVGGTLSLDLSSQRLGAGGRSSQSALFGDINVASYVWQPWFIQLRGGLGLLLSSAHSGQQDNPSNDVRSTALTANVALAVFPASRFPFELRADMSDSRTLGDALGAAYRSQRVSLSQGWRPARGNDNLQLNLDFSRLIAADGGADTLTHFTATGTRQLTEHYIELGASFSRNDSSDGESQSRLAALTARHNYHPVPDLNVDTLATYNDARLRGAAGTEFGSDVRQLSTLVSWRPRDGQWLHAPDAPLQVTGTARWVDAGSSGSSGGSDGAVSSAQAFNATLGVTKDLSRTWRLAGAVSLGQVRVGASPAIVSTSANAAATWVPTALRLADWQYGPTAAVSASLSRSSQVDGRHSAGLQLAHSLARSFVFGAGHTLALSASQSAGAHYESGRDEVAKVLSHSAGLSWQALGDGASQTFASLTLSDSRSSAKDSGSFQLVNLQLTRRTQLSRSASWSANMTLQSTRSESTPGEALTGQQRSDPSGWQQFHSASLSYENQRVFGVPRLRFTALLAANSQQLERRSAGDIDAPLERISRSLEGRLDYAIGRLEARLIARQANLDGKSVSAVFARLQRRF